MRSAGSAFAGCPRRAWETPRCFFDPPGLAYLIGSAAWATLRLDLNVANDLSVKSSIRDGADRAQVVPVLETMTGNSLRRGSKLQKFLSIPMSTQQFPTAEAIRDLSFAALMSSVAGQYMR